jgi:proteasome lid subunit RPN8/RPN11
MLDETLQAAPNESCGLLAGKNNSITAIFPARNAATAPATAYEIAPRELFTIFREIRSQRLEFLGIYHSHPHADNSPSATDIERAFYPEAAYFIIAFARSAHKPVRAFRIHNGNMIELQIEEVS